MAAWSLAPAASIPVMHSQLQCIMPLQNAHKSAFLKTPFRVGETAAFSMQPEMPEIPTQIQHAWQDAKLIFLKNHTVIYAPGSLNKAFKRNTVSLNKALNQQ